MKKTAKTKSRATIRARRSIHKKVILHPLVMFLLLCGGVLLISLTWQATAADYAVKAKVPAAPINQPAVITSPPDGSHFKTKPINVAGTCQYQSYINLYRNGFYSGTALCQPDGSFSLQTDLSPGANVLEAHIFNITDDEGPLGAPVTVYYDPPVPLATPGSASSSPFILDSEYKYKGYAIGETVVWRINVRGGTPPYGFNVKWGDRSEGNYVLEGKDYLDIEHAYNQAGNFTVEVRATDLRGSGSFLQLLTIVTRDKNALTAAGPASKTKPPTIITKSILLWIWPAYAILLAMALSFWLGERQEYYALIRKRRRAH